MKCRYLEGEDIAPKNRKEAKKLVGKEVVYLRKSDIDRSGRGYFFPQKGKIVEIKGKNIALNSHGNWAYISDIVEMAEISGEGK